MRFRAGRARAFENPSWPGPLIILDPTVLRELRKRHFDPSRVRAGWYSYTTANARFRKNRNQIKRQRFGQRILAEWARAGKRGKEGDEAVIATKPEEPKFRGDGKRRGRRAVSIFSKGMGTEGKVDRYTSNLPSSFTWPWPFPLLLLLLPILLGLLQDSSSSGFHLTWVPVSFLSRAAFFYCSFRGGLLSDVFFLRIWAGVGLWEIHFEPGWRIFLVQRNCDGLGWSLVLSCWLCISKSTGIFETLLLTEVFNVLIWILRV